MNTLLYTPQIDTRSGNGQISSRIGLDSPAFAFDAEHDFYEHAKAKHETKQIHCVLVDEAQFLQPQQVLQLTLVCDRLHIPVICYGTHRFSWRTI